MPRTLKRRSDAISRDATPEDSASPEPPQRRQRSSSASSSTPISDDDEDAGQSQAAAQQKTLVKKLVRLALAKEYSRAPIRRADVSTLIFKGTNSSRQFKTIFAEAQRVLETTFGMKMGELPTRERTTLKERRTQTTQTKAPSASSKSWILVSTLPDAYKHSLDIIQPSHAPSQTTEADNELPEQKLERYLKRLNADTQTMFGSTEKLKLRMIREGYIERKKENIQGEDVFSLTVGPRGKLEVGADGVKGLVNSVYGHGVAGPDGVPKIEADELNKRLARSLGLSNQLQQQDGLEDGAGDDDAQEGDVQEQNQRRRTGRRGQARGEEGDDDDYR